MEFVTAGVSPLWPIAPLRGRDPARDSQNNCSTDPSTCELPGQSGMRREVSKKDIQDIILHFGQMGSGDSLFSNSLPISECQPGPK